MRVLGRASAWLAVTLALWTGIMLGLSGGLYGFLSCDADGKAVADGLRELMDRDPAVVPRLEYLGDSNGVCVEKHSPVPTLSGLLEQGVGGGGLGPGWTFESQCLPGYNGYDFERLASKLLRNGPIPRAVLIPVSLRSLNTLGSNGFGAKRPVPDLWKVRTAGGEWRVVPGACVRAWWVWNRRLLAMVLPTAEDPEAWPVQRLPPQRHIRIHQNPPVDKALQFQVIYGAGYRLDYKLLGVLLQTGCRLRAAGAEVFYVVSPAPMDELERLWGRACRTPVEAGDHAVVRFLADRGFQVLDLHLGEQDGFYESPGEHLDGPARRDYAGRLLRWMSGALKRREGASPC
ncbi:MAG TPA: hypothetical protein VK842_09740 [bacterium]|jgi:hypothetical protein|nr:hypothetical protein [bacterium]